MLFVSSLHLLWSENALCLFIILLLFKNFKFYIGVDLINSVVLVAGLQWSHWYTYYASVLLKILFTFRLLQSIEQSSTCYTVGPCWFSILNVTVCTCLSQTPNLSLPPLLPLPP